MAYDVAMTGKANRGMNRPFRPAWREPAWRRRVLAASLAGAAQVALLAVLLWQQASRRPAQETQTQPPLEISFLAPPKPAAPTAAELDAAAPPNAVPVLPAVAAPMLTIARAPSPGKSDLLSDSQLAGAARAGGGGGGCDIAGAVQQALRRDALVARAVADSGRQGKAILLWGGDWVQSGDQEGKGLSAVREAVMWDVAFAPQACREQRLHGLVVLTLSDGTTRFAIGDADWRWSDLLGIKGGSSSR